MSTEHALKNVEPDSSISVKDDKLLRVLINIKKNSAHITTTKKRTNKY